MIIVVGQWLRNVTQQAPAGATRPIGLHVPSPAQEQKQPTTILLALLPHWGADSLRGEPEQGLWLFCLEDLFLFASQSYGERERQRNLYQLTS